MIVAATGDYGKPRPAIVIRSDAFPETHASVILCQMTSTIAEAPDFRVTVAPDAANGLRESSQIMADKPVAVRRARVGRRSGGWQRLTFAASTQPSPSPWGWRTDAS